MLMLSWTVALVSLALALGVRLVPLRQHRLLDGMYVSALLCFGAFASVQLLDAHFSLAPRVRFLAFGLSYQLLVCFVTSFLLVLMPRRQRRLRPLAWVQAVLGSVLLVLQVMGGLPAGSWWEGFNVLFSAGIVLALLLALWRGGSTRSWMVVLVALAGFWVLLSDVLGARGRVLGVSWAQAAYSLMLILLWLYATRRIGRPVAVWPAVDRRQLAQDLHDGVGSQLSTIISGLDQSTLQGRLVALALQECLVELKLVVDGMSEEQSVVELLACLRYRMEPMLSFAGIRMIWNLVDHEQLERIVGAPAREILRIAQEGLANVVRHAEADAVKLTLCHMKERHCLLLEIEDNGVGLSSWHDPHRADGRPVSNWSRLVPPPETESIPGPLEALHPGQGLRGMHWRAHRLGGDLRIGPAQPQGTRIALQVPMERLLAGPA